MYIVGNIVEKLVNCSFLTFPPCVTKFSKVVGFRGVKMHVRKGVENFWKPL